MGLFNEKIYNEYENLRHDARKEILEQAEEIAEDILNDLLDEHDLEDLCMDIDNTIYSEDADIKIRDNADINVMWYADNRITTLALPEDVEEHIDIENIVAMGGGEDLDTLFKGIAYEAWIIMIRDALKKLLTRECARTLSQ